jgi:hypothetical protein
MSHKVRVICKPAKNAVPSEDLFPELMEGTKAARQGASILMNSFGRGRPNHPYQWRSYSQPPAGNYNQGWDSRGRGQGFRRNNRYQGECFFYPQSDSLSNLQPLSDDVESLTDVTDLFSPVCSREPEFPEQQFQQQEQPTRQQRSREAGKLDAMDQPSSPGFGEFFSHIEAYGVVWFSGMLCKTMFGKLETFNL